DFHVTGVQTCALPIAGSWPAGAAAEGLAWSRPNLSSYHGAVRERCAAGSWPAGAAAEGLAWSRPDLSSYHGAVRERCGSGVTGVAGPRERPPRAWLGRGPIFHPTTAPFGSGVGALCRGELARGSGRRGCSCHVARRRPDL